MNDLIQPLSETSPGVTPVGTDSYLRDVSDNQPQKPWVGVMLLGSSGLELLRACLRDESPFNLLVYVPSMDQEQERWLRRLDIRYTTDLKFFLFQCPHLSAGITFGALAHLHHRKILVAISLLRQLGIPVVDIQHGLFQWGINFQDDKHRQGFDQSSGISLPMKTCADLQLTWAGENAIGYPRHPAPAKLNCAGQFLLIATNTNWHIYCEEERWRLTRLLRDLFDGLPGVPIVWKPHPAEHASANSSLAVLINEIATQRSRFPHVRIIPGQGPHAVPLDQLVAQCHAGIATLGTAVIDFESQGKPCVVYATRSVNSMLDTLQRCDHFSDAASLNAWLQLPDIANRIPVTGRLREYSASKLWTHITRVMKPTASCGHVDLQSVLTHVVLAGQLEGVTTK